MPQTLTGNMDVTIVPGEGCRVGWGISDGHAAARQQILSMLPMQWRNLMAWLWWGYPVMISSLEIKSLDRESGKHKGPHVQAQSPPTLNDNNCDQLHQCVYIYSMCEKCGKSQHQMRRVSSQLSTNRCSLLLLNCPMGTIRWLN